MQKDKPTLYLSLLGTGTHNCTFMHDVCPLFGVYVKIQCKETGVATQIIKK